MKNLLHTALLALLWPIQRFYERHLCLYVAFYSSEVSQLIATPPTRVKVNKLQGRIRYALGIYTVLATAIPAIADTVAFVRIPRGARILGWLGLLSWTAGQAAETLNLGDAVTPARHLAATAVTAAGTAVPNLTNFNNGASFETTNDTLLGADPTALNDTDVRSTVAGAAMVAAQVVACHMAFTQD